VTAMIEAVPQDWRRFDDLELPPTLAGAMEAFHEQGFHATSVRDVANRVGLTVPALYYHHGSKEGMLVELLSGSVQHLHARLRMAVADAGSDPAAQFANFVECIVLFMAHRRELAVLDAEIRALSTPNRRAYAKVRKQIEDLLRSIVREGVASGAFCVAHPQDTVRALLGMLQAVAGWYDPHGILTPDQLSERYIEITLQTVGAGSRKAVPERKNRRPA
jgi:AcrR family transcriptional regulator